MAVVIWDVIQYTITALVGCLTLLISWIVFYLHKKHREFAHIPGPPRASFFFGHLPVIKRRREESGAFAAQILQEWMKTYGPTFVVFIVNQPVVITINTNAVKEILVTGPYVKSEASVKLLGHLFGERFIGRGIVLDPENKRRTIMNPAMNRKFLRSIMNEFNYVGDQLMKKLEQWADGKTIVNLAAEFHNATLDAIGKVAFGKDLRSLNDDTSPFPQAINMAFKGLSTKLRNPFADWLFWKDRPFKKSVREACRVLRKASKAWVEERHEAISKGEEVPQDILTHCILAQNADPELISAEEMYDDIVTFFVAGQETTAGTLGFTAYELCRRPDIVEKVRAELDTALEGRMDIEFEDLGKLEYTSMLFKETLRLYPAAPLIFKELAQDSTVDGYHVPKGVNVVASPFISGRNGDFHPEPLKFKPERFDPKCEYRPSMYTYFPFSLGARNCIGQNFAQIEAKVILAKLLHKFDMKLDPDYKFAMTEVTTIRPTNGVLCTLSLRQ